MPIVGWISVAAASALITLTTYNLYNKTQKLKEQVKCIKAIETAQKKVALKQEGINSNIKLSELLQNPLPEKEKILLNNFQSAINYAVLKQNINNPDCNDLANTNLITKSDCLHIINKKNDYAKVDYYKAGIKVDNNKIATAIKSKNRVADDTGDNVIIPITKTTINATRSKKIKNNRISSMEINSIAKTADENQIEEYSKSIQKKMETVTNVDDPTKQLSAVETGVALMNRSTQIQKIKLEREAKKNKTQIDQNKNLKVVEITIRPETQTTDTNIIKNSENEQKFTIGKRVQKNEMENVSTEHNNAVKVENDTVEVTNIKTATEKVSKMMSSFFQK